MRAGMVTGSLARQWGSHGGETFVAVALTKEAACPAEYWLVDLGHATVTQVTKQAQDNSDWDIVGTLGTWEQVMRQELNFNVAVRSCALRYCDNGDASPLAADTRIGIVGKLLGLVDWR